MLQVKTRKTFGKKVVEQVSSAPTDVSAWELGDELTQKIKQARVCGDIGEIKRLDLQMRRLFWN